MQTMTTNNSQREYKTRTNWQIKVPQVRLVKDDGTSVILATRDALKMAQDQNLDLVEINSKASPVIVRIIDFGKFQYEQSKKAKANKKNQQVQELREITFKSNTDSNDLKHKLEKAKEFITEGNKVKFTVRFRGRELSHTELAKEKIIWMIDQLGNLIDTNIIISLEGKVMWTIVSPAKNKVHNDSKFDNE